MIDLFQYVVPCLIAFAAGVTVCTLVVAWGESQRKAEATRLLHLILWPSRPAMNLTLRPSRDASFFD